MRFNTLFNYCPVCGSDNFVQNNQKSKRCKTCGFVLYINPSAATAAFILNEKNELLVCRRGKEPVKGTLDLPGGFIDENETGEQGIAREIKEEVGIDANEIQYIFSLPNEYLFSNFTIPTLDLFFDVKLVSYDNLQAADDVEECFFVPLNEVDASLFGLKSVRKAVMIYLERMKK